MNKNRILIVLTVILFASYLVSCKKEDTSCVLTHQYYKDSIYYLDFFYNGDKLDRYVFKNENDRLVQTVYYTYLSNGNLSYYSIIDSNDVTLYKYEYIYNAQNQAERENYYVLNSGTLKLSSYWIYAYNASGFLKSYIYYINTTIPFVNSSQEYSEFDADGNYTKGVLKNGLGIITDSIFVTYDNHPNPLKNSSPSPNTSSHNIVKRVSKNVSGSMYTINYTNKYNSKGFLIYTYEDEDDTEVYFKYDCGM